jgi:hypothetical protein
LIFGYIMQIKHQNNINLHSTSNNFQKKNQASKSKILFTQTLLWYKSIQDIFWCLHVYYQINTFHILIWFELGFIGLIIRLFSNVNIEIKIQNSHHMLEICKYLQTEKKRENFLCFHHKTINNSIKLRLMEMNWNYID